LEFKRQLGVDYAHTELLEKLNMNQDKLKTCFQRPHETTVVHTAPKQTDIRSYGAMPHDDDLVAMLLTMVTQRKLKTVMAKQ